MVSKSASSPIFPEPMYANWQIRMTCSARPRVTSDVVGFRTRRQFDEELPAQRARCNLGIQCRELVRQPVEQLEDVLRRCAVGARDPCRVFEDERGMLAAQELQAPAEHPKL